MPTSTVEMRYPGISVSGFESASTADAILMLGGLGGKIVFLGWTRSNLAARTHVLRSD